MATIYNDFGHLGPQEGQQQEQQEGQHAPETAPGSLLTTSLPKQPRDQKFTEDFHQSHFSSSDLSEAKTHDQEKLVAFSLSFEKSSVSNDL